MKILYQDKNLAAIYKPALLHSVKGESAGSLVEELQKDFPLTPFMESDKECGMMNRLDFETSGIILVAKDKETYLSVKELTKNNGIQKNYLYVSNQLLTDYTICKIPIGSRGRSNQKVTAKENGKKKDRLTDAETEFFPVGQDSTGRYGLIAATIFQGRRHQIRVHAKKIGCPLLYDRLYSDYSKTGEDNSFLLHNFEVLLKHPITQHPLRIWADLSEQFIRFLSNDKWEIRKSYYALFDSALAKDIICT